MAACYLVTRPLLFWCRFCRTFVSERANFSIITINLANTALNRRRQVIIRERLKFPSGFSTAVLISVLHGEGKQSTKQELDTAAQGGFAALVPRDDFPNAREGDNAQAVGEPISNSGDPDWASNLRLLVVCFFISGIATIATYFFPMLRNIPIFGPVVAQTWLWTLNPSLAYVGQGIIMGTETTMHMLLGAMVGWAILSPLAKLKGWAPGPVDDWEHGSKGWIVWVSLAIMLVDAVVSLAYVAIRSLATSSARRPVANLLERARQSKFGHLIPRSSHDYSLLQAQDDSSSDEDEDLDPRNKSVASSEDEDAPKEQLISNKAVMVGLAASVILCIITIHTVFGALVPLYATVIAVFMALILSIMGVRALGETDLNPVSGISKLAQLFFALIIPQSHKSSVLINLVAGAVVSLRIIKYISRACANTSHFQSEAVC